MHLSLLEKYYNIYVHTTKIQRIYVSIFISRPLTTVILMILSQIRVAVGSSSGIAEFRIDVSWFRITVGSMHRVG